MDQPAHSSQGSLQPRFRRLLSFGDVLDESIQLFRRHWIVYAQISAVALLPPGFVQVWLAATGITSRSINLLDLQTGALPQQTSALSSQPVVLIAGVGIGVVFWILWTSAIVVATDDYLRGRQPSLRHSYWQALECFPGVLAGSVVFGIGLAVTSILGGILLALTVFGLVGSLIAFVALLFWWLRRGARKPWVKWLIILASPLGLPTYFYVAWSMFAAAAVLERSGPLGCLRRSSELVDRHWFRVGTVLSVGGLIVGVLIYAPAALIDIPLTIINASRGELGLGPTAAAISNAVSVVLQIVFASIGLIIYTLLFIDLRNRREGTDIVERLTQLEGAPSAVDG